LIMKTFFIAALPRSGTAWVSNFLTTGDSICLHDGIKYITDGYANTLQATGRRFCGDSGSHIQMIYKELLEAFPDAKFAAIVRSPSDVIDSLKDMLMPIDGLEESRNQLFEMITSNEDILVVRFEDLFNDESKARELWEHCIGVGFDPIRWRLLAKLNVQCSDKALDETIQFVKDKKAINILNL